MSEEELNQELSTDELKDVAGGSWTVQDNLFKTTGLKKENDSVFLGPIGHDGISKPNSSVELGPIGHDGIASKGKRKTP
ncbi:hypothetical protein [Prochlorococcus marinus]|uniref:hypothetical protein n=1 Tax=Prochlorococcus marinus TaxID=1219 RepID=UPI0022B59787|nr:hypothetical protein [Prochlorococcus marinus]